MSATVIDFPEPTEKVRRYVKIRRYGEAFWVLVDAELLGTIDGTVSNYLITDRLRFGDRIHFLAGEIIEEHNKP